MLLHGCAYVAALHLIFFSRPLSSDSSFTDVSCHRERSRSADGVWITFKGRSNGTSGPNISFFPLPTTYQTSTAQHITSAELLLFSFCSFFLTSSLALNTWLYSFCHILFFLPSSLFSSPPDVGAGPENSCCSSPFVSCKTSVDVKVMHNREDGKKPILHQIFRHFGWSNMRKRK